MKFKIPLLDFLNKNTKKSIHNASNEHNMEAALIDSNELMKQKEQTFSEALNASWLQYRPKSEVKWRPSGIVTLFVKEDVGSDFKQSGWEYLLDCTSNFTEMTEELKKEIDGDVSFKVFYRGGEWGNLLDSLKRKYGNALPVNVCWHTLDLSLNAIKEGDSVKMNFYFRHEATPDHPIFGFSVKCTEEQVVDSDFKGIITETIKNNIGIIEQRLK